jgi:hypothetical protein
MLVLVILLSAGLLGFLLAPSRSDVCQDACEARGADFVHFDRYGCVCQKGETTIELLDPGAFHPVVLPAEFLIPD